MVKTTPCWNEETGEAMVILYDTKLDKRFIGIAQCHEQDQDMKSELTGLSIAEYRAQINMFQYYKEYYSIKLKALKDFESASKNCKYYNSDFQIENLLKKQIQNYETALTYVNLEIKTFKEQLQEYLTAKSKLYQKLRENRNKPKETKPND